MANIIHIHFHPKVLDTDDEDGLYIFYDDDSSKIFTKTSDISAETDYIKSVHASFFETGE